MNINSYAYAEVLDVLDNMESEYVEKIPQAFINYLKENSSNEYEKHVTLDKPLEKQNLNSKTLSILAAINLKYWVESEEHKQELLNQYRKNGIKRKEKLNEKLEINEIFDTANKLEKVNIKEEINSTDEEINAENLPVEKKSFFKRIIDFFASKIFE